MLATMAVGKTNAPAVRPLSTGHAIASRRKWLGLTAEDVVERTNNAINLKLLSQLENNRYDPRKLTLGKYQALLRVLKWTPAEFEEATGVPPLTSEYLPGATEYTPTLRVPVMGTVSAGLAAIEEMGEAESYVHIDPGLSPALASAAPRNLYALRVNGDSMVSDKASLTVPDGSIVIVEVGAVAEHGNLVVAWLPNRETLVVKLFQEGRDGEGDVVLRSYNPRGPMFRLGAEPIEVRGVVRLVHIVPK